MHVVWACLCLYNLYSFLLAQLSEYLSYVLSNLSVYCHPSVLRCKNYVVLTSPSGMF